MWLADIFSPRRADRFFALLRQHSEILVKASQEFRQFVMSGSPQLSEQINQLRTEGAAVLGQLTSALRDAFVTPIDRQDIYNLGEGIDDMLNYINNAAREISLFGVQATPQMQDMAQILEMSAERIGEAVAHLRSDPQRAWKCSRDLQQAESLVEDRYRKALAELFNGSDIRTILKQREVYRHLSNSADRAQAVGRLVGKVIVKAT